jgi:hypothetical protein
MVEFAVNTYAEPVASADGGRDAGFSKFLVFRRGRRC